MASDLQTDAAKSNFLGKASRSLKLQGDVRSVGVSQTILALASMTEKGPILVTRPERASIGNLSNPKVQIQI